MSSIRILPNFKSSPDCENIYWSDQTPWYNSLTAPGGYDLTGVNSLDPNDVDTNKAYLDITQYGSTSTYTIQIPSSNFDINEIGKSGFSTAVIPGSTFGSTSIPDAVYAITYRYKLLSTGQEYKVSCYFPATCNLCCCMDNKLKVLGCCKDCSDTKAIYELYRAHMLKDKINYLLECNDPQGAQDLIECLTEFCSSKKCTNC